MNNTNSSHAAAPSMLRRKLHLQLQLLILPGIILLLIAMLMMPGCTAAGHKSVASASKCSPEEQRNCICKKPGVISFTVEGMGCPNCAKELTEILRGVPGVTEAKVCFEDKKAFVTLDKDRPATMEAIQAAVAKRQEEHLKLENDPNCLKPKG
ncbi:MAG: heavy-metal-associated domain-containing protein [Phycisphaerales bacterium]